MEEPSEAISALGETLAADGRAFIVDPTEFAPSAMVTAAICPVRIWRWGTERSAFSREMDRLSFGERIACRLGKIDDGLFISLSSRTSPPIDLTLLALL